MQNTSNLDKVLGSLGTGAAYLAKLFGDSSIEAVKLLALADPERMNEVDLDKFKNQIEDLKLKHIEACENRTKEIKDVTDLEDKMQKSLAAAEFANKKFLNETEGPEKTKYENQMKDFLATAEKCNEQLPKERIEAEAATEFANSLDNLLNEKKDQIERREKAFAEAKRNLELAEIKLQAFHTKQEIEAMKENPSGALDVCISAMSKKTQKLQAELSTAEFLKKPETKDVFTDPEMVKTLEEAGLVEPSKESLSFEERINALKKSM